MFYIMKKLFDNFSLMKDDFWLNNEANLWWWCSTILCLYWGLLENEISLYAFF